MKTVLLGLLALATPAVAQAPNWAKGTPIYVTMTNRGFTPRRIQLKANTVYTLHVTNRSDQGHNLTARGFFSRAARVAPRDRGWVAHDRLSLEAGQRATVHFILPNMPPSRYEFRSTTLADAATDYRGGFYVN